MATMMMRNKMKKKGVASLEELREICIESDVKLIGSQMTVDLFDFKQSDFIEQTQFGGAAMFLGFAGDADISLYI